MSEPKKLIEVAMPIKEISAESVRDGRIQHGHISSMHKWWARRPLPVSRAVIFASLVPDPLDVNCPKSFCDAVELLLGKNSKFNSYEPYKDIPYTTAIDLMEDNLRNRLLMFIGKFSNKFIKDIKLGVKTESKDVISNFSLIKCETKNNFEILDIARKLIFVYHNSSSNISAKDYIKQFDYLFNEIKKAENILYQTINRHIKNDDIKSKELALENAKSEFLSKMPLVFDPFAGGGAIPLEASRLGCRSYGNDINPVAHVIQKCGLEFPQKFGKPIIYAITEFIKKYDDVLLNNLDNNLFQFTNGTKSHVIIDNILAFDLKYHSNKIINDSSNLLSKYYPKDKNGRTPIFYYWVKLGKCSNPSCKAEVPLLKSFYLVNTKNKSIYLNPIIQGNKINFEIKSGKIEIEPWVKRGNLICPCCSNNTDSIVLKKQFISKLNKERILAIAYEGGNGKEYSLPTEMDINILSQLPEIEASKERMPTNYTQAMPCCTWGITYWSDLFNKRQLVIATKIVELFNDYKISNFDIKNDYDKSLVSFLGIWIDRIISRLTSFGLIDTGRETVVDLFGRQAIPMVFDYPETNPFMTDQLSWIIKVIENESFEFPTVCNNASSGEKDQFDKKSITAVVTDPPYYDAIAYADLSDFFYVWMKQTLGDLFPLNFSTPQTPKSDECTALKHHHEGNENNAKIHFENKLLEIFDSIERQTKDIVSIMFAHQSTEAWTTLCNSILGANMNITGSWANDTELTAALKSDKAFLSSSVTVSCKPSQKIGIGEYRKVKEAIEKRVEQEVLELYKLGFRGSDLLTACFGQAVSEFGRYERVEKADGSAVTVSELLEIARESAFNSLLKGFDGDDFTKFYIGWMQLNGLVDTVFDDAAKFTKVGLSIDVQDLFKEHILIKNGNKQHLGSYKERFSANNRLGEGRNISIIDQAHRLMHLYSSPNRNNLLKYIEANSFEAEHPVWRVLNSLAELLPKDIEDHKLAVGLLTNKDQLIREAKSSNTPKPEQGKLTFE